MILVLASIVARQEHFARALSMSQEHVARSRAEPGCLAHAVHQDLDHPLRLVFVEQWDSRAALSEHFRLAASREFAKTLAGLASEQPQIALYEATPIQLPAHGST
jgi:quinol monooxygenase YgiN